MPNAHRFYVPVGVVSLAAPPPGPQIGDTYFDTTIGSLQTWDGTAWVGGGPSEAELDAKYVNVAGDTMRGPLVQGGDSYVRSVMAWGSFSSFDSVAGRVLVELPAEHTIGTTWGQCAFEINGLYSSGGEWSLIISGSLGFNPAAALAARWLPPLTARFVSNDPNTPDMVALADVTFVANGTAGGPDLPRYGFVIGNAVDLNTVPFTIDARISAPTPINLLSYKPTITALTDNIIPAEWTFQHNVIPTIIGGGPKKYVATVGDGVAVSHLITHNLGTSDITVSLFDTVTGRMMTADTALVDVNSITVTFELPLAVDQIKVVVIG